MKIKTIGIGLNFFWLCSLLFVVNVNATTQVSTQTNNANSELNQPSKESLYHNIGVENSNENLNVLPEYKVENQNPSGYLHKNTDATSKSNQVEQSKESATKDQTSQPTQQKQNVVGETNQQTRSEQPVTNAINNQTNNQTNNQQVNPNINNNLVDSSSTLKLDVIAQIKKLKYLTQKQKDGYIKQINQSQNEKEINNLLKNAKIDNQPKKTIKKKNKKNNFWIFVGAIGTLSIILLILIISYILGKKNKRQK